MKIKDLQDYIDGYLIEVGGRAEELFDRHNAHPIQSVYAKGLLKKDVEETGDGYHYRREIKGQMFTKKICGYKDEGFFNMIVSKIQEEMEYEDDFNDTENVVNESLSDEKRICSAVFIIGRVNESLDEYGYDCITHKTHKDVCQSIELLRQMKNHVKDRRIDNYIELGEYIIEEYPILAHYELHSL